MVVQPTVNSSAERKQTARGITREIAEYATRSSYAGLPDHVRAEAARAFLNWMGCVLGGCREPAVEAALAAITETGGGPQASIIGRGLRSDMASAAFVNCLSSSALGFDDTHLATVTHPTGPVAAALFAYAEKTAVIGEEFVNALALGIEIECRLSNVLLLPPAEANLALYVTGITGPIGAAVALGRLLHFDEQTMTWAIGLAATQASGFRATHSSMAGLVVPAIGARNGVAAAILASKGFNCTDGILEGDKGFAQVFARGADLDRAVVGLGRDHEMLLNAYKPYPCGIVIHAAIDACLQVASQLATDAEFKTVTITVPPLTLALTDRRSPPTSLQAVVSLYHWAAAALLRRSAGIPEMQQDCIDDPAIAALRARINAVADPTLQRDEAIAEVTLTSGVTLRSHIVHASGSVEQPMTDDDLDTKFRLQAHRVLSNDAANRVLRLCRNVSALQDVGKDVSAAFDA